MAYQYGTGTSPSAKLQSKTLDNTATYVVHLSIQRATLQYDPAAAHPGRMPPGTS